LADFKDEEFEQILAGLLHNPHIGIVMVDKDGYITVPNQTYLDYLEMQEEDVIGKHILEVTPNSKLPEVLETGEVHLADKWTINGHDFIVTRIPIIKAGEIVGAIGKTLFLDMAGLETFNRKLQQMEKELKLYKQEVRQLYSAKWTFEDIIGENPTFLKTKRIAKQLPRTASTVLITGESGTGKELFAHSIHTASVRRVQPFVRVNCAALPHTLLESELFGYEEGAFTGARKGGKPGKFELANQGTIFLDEIGDMPLNMQTELLTVLQEKVIERVGGTKPIFLNVRVIAATNQNLEEMVKRREFREDLFYRLNVVRLNIPPLRERLDDLPLLVDKLMARINERVETRINMISDEALRLLSEYQWPGNIRELENLLESAIILAHMNHDKKINRRHFPSLLRQTSPEEKGGTQPSLSDALDNLEKEMILHALEQSGGNRAQAAKILGLHTSAFYRRLEKYGFLGPASPIDSHD